jgi:hypothetical protein
MGGVHEALNLLEKPIDSDGFLPLAYACCSAQSVPPRQ